jgi:uncharacterized repeat protein (TIGR02543 family)
MKRVVFSSLVIAAAMIFSVALTVSSCDFIEETKKYTVTFNNNGGSDVPEQIVKNGEKISKPADPTRDGYDFDGWAKANNETSELWNFASETVSADMTLYAKWIEVEEVDNSGVYVAGSVDGRAVLWKNGITQYLTDYEDNIERANSVFVVKK